MHLDVVGIEIMGVWCKEKEGNHKFSKSEKTRFEMGEN